MVAIRARPVAASRCPHQSRRLQTCPGTSRRGTPLSCWPRCISPVTSMRQRPATLIFMTALAVISALMTALCVGYYFGRRAGSPPLTWKSRTSRARLGKLAMGLVVLMIARRVQHGLPRQFVEPLGLRRLRTWRRGSRPVPRLGPAWASPSALRRSTWPR